jgi:hypothetical protein
MRRLGGWRQIAISTHLEVPSRSSLTRNLIDPARARAPDDHQRTGDHANGERSAFMW